MIYGKAVPEGNTIYVLRRDIKNNKVELWNPTTGEPFYFGVKEFINTLLCFTISKGLQSDVDIQDIACPLQEVGCVISNENIWLNIQ